MGLSTAKKNEKQSNQVHIKWHEERTHKVTTEPWYTISQGKMKKGKIFPVKFNNSLILYRVIYCINNSFPYTTTTTIKRKGQYSTLSKHTHTNTPTYQNRATWIYDWKNVCAQPSTSSLEFNSLHNREFVCLGESKHTPWESQSDFII